MTKEEKDLLLKDLCARMPYGVRVKIFDKEILSYENNEKGTLDGKETISGDNFVIKCDKDSWIISCDDFKPYLRPMSSMTEDEKKELHSILNKEMDRTFEKLKSGDCGIDEGKYYFNSDYELDFCLSHHFDYRGLIPMGLAIEAKEGMYK